MKLSEAIRLSGMDHPQLYGHFATPIGIGTCALGGAYKMVGRDPLELELASLGFPAMSRPRDLLLPYFPIIDEPVPQFLFPPGGLATNGNDCMHAIVFLNDAMHWTRSQIADWVEKLEGYVDGYIVSESQLEPQQSQPEFQYLEQVSYVHPTR